MPSRSKPALKTLRDDMDIEIVGDPLRLAHFRKQRTITAARYTIPEKQGMEAPHT